MLADQCVAELGADTPDVAAQRGVELSERSIKPCFPLIFAALTGRSGPGSRFHCAPAARPLGGRSGAAQKRIGEPQAPVDDVQDTRRKPRRVTVDEIAHHLEGDVGDRLRADR